ncbi:hypothetical protein CLAIMM_13231, partial [Cladophialophora immunda]
MMFVKHWHHEGRALEMKSQPRKSAGHHLQKAEHENPRVNASSGAENRRHRATGRPKSSPPPKTATVCGERQDDKSQTWSDKGGRPLQSHDEIPGIFVVRKATQSEFIRPL